ncbi:MAG: DnaJ domain-containing protein [Lachnospiraceae bacterium]|nr:DnaJ domain-containing protein [Lachnospiraceae bacterium]
MAKRDYYEILGVPKSAKDQEIKSAYRKLAKKYHPDSNPDNRRAEQLFKEVTEAYNVLSDAEKRKLYDRFGHAAFDGSMGSDPEAFAKQYGQYRDGGGHFHRGADGNGTFYREYFTGEENGDDYRSFYQEDDMEDLFGGMFDSFFRGGRHGDPFSADREYHYESPGSLDLVSEMTVSFREAALGCEKVISFDGDKKCTLAVRIPAGIGEGQSVRLKGKGRCGRDGRSGDLLIQVHVMEDARFTRKGKDVYITQNIPYTTAILGGEAMFETLYGPVACRIPAGSQPGSRLRLKNKGIVSMKNKNSYGDEYVIIQISVPKNISEKEKELLQKLKEMEGRKTA